MQRSRFGVFGLAVAAALAMGAVATAGAPAQAAAQKAVMTPTGRRYETRRERFSGSDGFGRRHGRRAAYGWTNAHQKRVARKKRNQARHRRACRG